MRPNLLLVLAILLPCYLADGFSSPSTSSTSRSGRVLIRRSSRHPRHHHHHASANHHSVSSLRMPSSGSSSFRTNNHHSNHHPPSQRFSRYIQEPSEQIIQQQERNEDSGDEFNPNEFEQVMNNAFGSGLPQQQPQLFSTSSPSSNGGSNGNLGGFTQMPYHGYNPSTASQSVQQKEDNDGLSQISQPPHQQMQSIDGSDGFGDTGDLPSTFPQQQQQQQQQQPQQQFQNGANGAFQAIPQSYSSPTSLQQPQSQQQFQHQSQQQNGQQNGHGNGDFPGSTFLGNGDDISGNNIADDSDFSDDGSSGGGTTIEMLKGSVRGEPGQDYPILSEIPNTSFKCSSHQYPGYYADVEAQCQVFHVCQPDGRHDAFLCPNGTIFSQRHFVCVWWFEFNCAESEQFYELNSALYKDGGASGSQPTGGSVQGGFGPDSAIASGGGAGQSLDGGHPLSSPKDQFNQMYQGQIDGFSLDGPLTTTAPVYYSNGRQPSMVNGAGAIMSEYGGRTTPRSRYEPTGAFAGGQDSSSVTPSPVMKESYETTPLNFDAALGEERTTPLIESLPLTTILPHVEQEVDMQLARNAGTGGQFFGAKMNNGKKFKNGGSKPFSSGGIKGGSNGKTSSNGKSMKMAQFPEGPMRKNGRNGNGNGNGFANGSSSPKKSSNNNGYKSSPFSSSLSSSSPASSPPSSSSSSYGTKM